MFFFSFQRDTVNRVRQERDLLRHELRFLKSRLNAAERDKQAAVNENRRAESERLEASFNNQGAAEKRSMYTRAGATSSRGSISDAEYQQRQQNGYQQQVGFEPPKSEYQDSKSSGRRPPPQQVAFKRDGGHPTGYDVSSGGYSGLRKDARSPVGGYGGKTSVAGRGALSGRGLQSILRSSSSRGSRSLASSDGSPSAGSSCDIAGVVGVATDVIDATDVTRYAPRVTAGVATDPTTGPVASVSDTRSGVAGLTTNIASGARSDASVAVANGSRAASIGPHVGEGPRKRTSPNNGFASVPSSAALTGSTHLLGPAHMTSSASAVSVRSASGRQVSASAAGIALQQVISCSSHFDSSHHAAAHSSAATFVSASSTAGPRLVTAASFDFSAHIASGSSFAPVTAGTVTAVASDSTTPTAGPQLVTAARHDPAIYVTAASDVMAVVTLPSAAQHSDKVAASSTESLSSSGI